MYSIDDPKRLAPLQNICLAKFPLSMQKVQQFVLVLLSSAGNPKPHLNVLPISGISESAQAHDQPRA